MYEKYKFRYCYCWKRWARVIWAMSGNVIELDLTPINGFRSDNSYVKRCELENFRSHCTSASPRDKFTNHLPEAVVKEMQAAYGEFITHRLIHHNYLQSCSPKDIMIANERSNGGGVPWSHVLAVKEHLSKLPFHST